MAKGKAQSTSIASAKNQKISEAMKRAHERKRLEKEAALRIEQQLSERFASISNYRDALRYDFTNLTPSAIRGVLNSTRTGYMLNWSDFCDYVLEMDSHVRGLVNIRTHAISGKNMLVEPADHSPEAIAAAEFVRTCFNNIPEFDKHKRQLLMAIFKGAAMQEIIYRRDEDRNCFVIEELIPISLRRVKIRLNPVEPDGQRFQTPATNGFGRWVYSYWNYGNNAYGEGIDVEEMFPGKFIIHSPGDEEIPHYRGLFRSLAFNWFFKQAGTAFWASGAEKYAFPVTYGKVPRTTTENARYNLVQNLNNLANDAAAVFDEDVIIDTINPGASGGDSVWKQFLSYLNSEMSKLILGATLNVEASSTGANRALGEVHERVREDLMAADAKALSETLTHQLAKPLLEYNLHLFGGKLPPLPKISFDITTRDYETISELHVKAGIITVNELRDSVGLLPWTSLDGGDRIVKLEDAANIKPQEGTPSIKMDITDGGAFQDATTAYANKPADKKKKTLKVSDQEIAEEMTDDAHTLTQLHEEQDIDLMLFIEKEGSEYVVKSESGRNLGKFKTRKEAVERLKQVEHFKNQ